MTCVSERVSKITVRRSEVADSLCFATTVDRGDAGRQVLCPV